MLIIFVSWIQDWGQLALAWPMGPILRSGLFTPIRVTATHETYYHFEQLRWIRTCFDAGEADEWRAYVNSRRASEQPHRT